MTPDHLRIAIVTEVFLPKFDGVVTTVLRSIDQLTARGHEVLVLAPGDPPSTYDGCRVQRIPSLPFRPWYPELSVGLPCPTLTRALDDFAPDVVHVVSPVCLAAFGALRARARDLPVVASYHTDIPQYVRALGLGALRPGASLWLRHVHNTADVNLCPSDPLAEEAVSKGIQRVRLWPGGVDTDLFRPGRRSAAMRLRLTGGRPESPLVLSVGRLSKEKSLDDLIAAMERLPDARVAFVGSGPYGEEVRRRCAHLPATFTGRLSGIELAQAYASADVFAFPSTTDTLGLVSLESMASGVPVVGARAGGIPDTIDEGVTGLLVRPHDPSALAAALASVLHDADRRARMGRAAREDALRRSWAAATDILVDAYDSAILRHAS
ncbi:glycosyltransferase family 4 protein [Schaalia naturae]|jgi:glycosyltransferase involved in cell wall biosynthesis|uniref:Glycosyltransferase family 4 protein n=1 Tax=Schaalia naturae TaxID=635203 RepID=A0ABW2SRC6_9ACTO